jgi:serine/threonine-protein kinase
MLTGRRLFAGEGTTDTLALVFTKDPEWSTLPPQVPPAVRALLKRCLERDRQKRIGDVAAIRFALEDLTSLSTPDQLAAGSHSSDVRGSQATRRWVFALMVTAIAVGLGTLSLARLWPSRTTTSANVTHLTVVPEGSLPTEGEAVIALSPDGRRLAYVAGRNGRQQLYLKELDQFVGKPIPGTEGAIAVTFSLDGNWLAFVAEGKIRKIAVAGGEPVELGDFGEDRGHGHIAITVLPRACSFSIRRIASGTSLSEHVRSMTGAIFPVSSNSLTTSKSAFVATAMMLPSFLLLVIDSQSP